MTSQGLGQSLAHSGALGNDAFPIVDHYAQLFELCSSKCSVYDIEAWLETFKDGGWRHAFDESGLTALHHVARAGNTSAAAALLASLGGPDLSHARQRLLTAQAPTEYGATPLHLAGFHSADVLHVFLPFLASPPAVDYSTPDPASTQLLLLNSRDARGQTLLHYAAQAANLSALQDLIPHFAQSLGIDVRDAAGRTPLTCAVAADRPEAVRKLLAGGAGMVPTPPSSWTPLHHAAMHNLPNMLKLLFEHAERVAGGRGGALLELNAADVESRTPLHIAAEYGCTAAAKELLALGAGPDRRDIGRATPLHLAAARGWVEIAGILARHLRGRHGDAAPGQMFASSASVRSHAAGTNRSGGPLHPVFYTAAGWTPAHLAAAANLPDVLRELVAEGLDDVDAPAAAPPHFERPHAAAFRGWTPLHCAVAAGAVDAASVLLSELGANPHATCASGLTPYDLIVERARQGRSDEEDAAAATAAGELQQRFTPLEEETAVRLAAAFVQLLHPVGSTGGSASTLQLRTPDPAPAWPSAPEASPSPARSPDAMPPGPPALPALPALPVGSGAGPARPRPVSPFAAMARRLDVTASLTPPPALPAPSARPPSGPFQALAHPEGPPATPPRQPSPSSQLQERQLRQRQDDGPQTPVPAEPLCATPATHGSRSSASSRAPSVSPLNSPWGASTLNRAIVQGSDKVVERLLRTLPARNPTIRLLAASAVDETVSAVTSPSPPSAAAGIGNAGQPRRAVVEDLGLQLEGMTVTSSFATSMSLARKLGGMSLFGPGSPGQRLGQSRSQESGAAGSSVAGSTNTVNLAVAADVAAAEPSVESHGNLAQRGQVVQVPAAQGAMALPEAFCALLAPMDPKAGKPAGHIDKPEGRWLALEATAANRDKAAWLGVDGLAASAGRGWASLELQLETPAEAAPEAPSGHVWVGVGRLRGVPVAAGCTMYDADRGMLRGERSMGSRTADAAAAAGWVCSAEGGELQQGVVLLDAVQGQVIEGSGGGSGGRRREKTLQLPAAGGRVGVLWELFGGHVVAVSNGCSPFVLAQDIPSYRSAPDADAVAAPMEAGAAATQLPLQLVVGAQLPQGWRLRVRAGHGRFSAACGCADELLTAAEAARWPEHHAPWPGKALMTSLHFAAWVGNCRLLPQLVRAKGFPPDEPDADGWTALHFAALGGHGEAVRALLDLGAHPDLYTVAGRTPCMLAAGSRLARGGGPALVECLRLTAASAAGSAAAAGSASTAASPRNPSMSPALRAVDERERTLLMMAAEAGNLEVVEWLLQQGLDPEARDVYGRTAQQYGSHNNDVYIALEQARRGHGRAGGGRGGSSAHQVGSEDSRGDSRSRDQSSGAKSALPRLRPWRWVMECSEVEWGRCLGGGGFGEVFEGTYLGNKVAIKRLRPNLTSRQEAALEKELSVLQSLCPHERVATFMGVVTCQDGSRGLVMSRYSTDLQKAFSKPDLRKRLTPRSRLLIALQLAEALRFLHNRTIPIIHRDLKPDNVLLTEKFDVKLCDFGLSQALGGAGCDGDGGSGQIESGDGYGHPYWMAPELLQNKAYSTKVDVWSWGVVFYQLAAWVDANLYDGIHQYAVRNAWATNGASTLPLTEKLPERLAPEVVGLLQDCLNPDPDKRPNMDAVLQRVSGVKELANPQG